MLSHFILTTTLYGIYYGYPYITDEEIKIEKTGDPGFLM